VNHPPLTQLAQHLRDLAKLLDTNAGHNRTSAQVGKCSCVECKAWLLGSGARGYPSSTLGDGTGTRTSDTTSSTERAAGILTDHPDPWAHIDMELRTRLHALWRSGLRVAATIDQIVAHAPDDDPLPAGTGPCTIRTCETVCRPDAKRPDNRLRAGLCPACRDAWTRYLRKNPTATLTEWRPVRTAALRPKPVTN
jgi:hypothetical protein